MSNKKQNRLKYMVLATFAFVALGVSFFVVSHKNREVQPQVNGIASVAATDSRKIAGIDTTKPKVVETEGALALYPSDFSDDRNLAGISHYIFVGKVIGEVKTEGWYTQFAVQVIDNIKGNLQGTVNVGVTGGYRDGVFYVAKGNTWLDSGSTYLLATRYRGIDRSYRLIRFDTAVSWKLLSADSTLTTDQLQSLAESDPRVKQLEVAYPNERLDEADVYHNNTLNSYISTHAPPPAPPPVPPPAIVVDSPPVTSNLTSVVASSSVTISWTTDKQTTAQLFFGSSTAMTANVPPDTDMAVSHSRHISYLVPGTTYYYEVQSQDASGTISTSAQQSFTF